MKEIVDNLNGYFQALRRLSLNTCDFWADAVDVNGTLNNAIDDYISKIDEVTLIEKKDVTCREVEELYKEFIFSNMNMDSDDIIKLFSWDIVEYYGLASTIIDPNGDFNPLVSNGAIQLSVSSIFHSSHVYYVVEIGTQEIITGLAVRA